MFQLKTITKVLRDGVQVTVHEATNHDLRVSKKLYRMLHIDKEDAEIADAKSTFCYTCVRTDEAQGIPFDLPNIADTAEELSAKFAIWDSLPEKLTEAWTDVAWRVAQGEPEPDPKKLGMPEKGSSTILPQ